MSFFYLWCRFYRGEYGDNTIIKISITLHEAATCLLDYRYANGNGAISTENNCAIRTVKIDGTRVGVFILPQHGKGEWRYSRALIGYRSNTYQPMRT